MLPVPPIMFFKISLVIFGQKHQTLSYHYVTYLKICKILRNSKMVYCENFVPEETNIIWKRWEASRKRNGNNILAYSGQTPEETEEGCTGRRGPLRTAVLRMKKNSKTATARTSVDGSTLNTCLLSRCVSAGAGHAVWGVGQWSLAFCDWGFEYRWRRGCRFCPVQYKQINRQVQ